MNGIVDENGKITDAEYEFRLKRALDQAFGVATHEAVERAIDKSKYAEAQWVYDPVVASKDSRTHSRPKNAPPHWVRCDFVRDGVRCIKGEGHEKGYGEHAKHEGPKP